jgi:hypothetical protein
MWATSEILKKTTRRKQSPNWQTFAQSGHPGAGQARLAALDFWLDEYRFAGA